MEGQVELNICDYIIWIEDLVKKYGVEIDIFAWYELKKILLDSIKGID